MHLVAIQRTLGLLLMVFSLAMLPPIAVGMYYQDGGVMPFVESFTLLLGIGFILWAPVRDTRHELRMRDGFVIVVLFWVGLGLAGSLPLIFSHKPSISVTDAVFESISGLTTTGATVLTGLDNLPRSILIYRQQLQWLGGMGIIVLAVAVLPVLGVGGMQVFRAETPGPVKEAKLTPRIAETTRALWYIYLFLTISCALAYLGAGMTLFDSVAHALSTVATGGFSTHDSSIGFYDSPKIELVAIVFMTLSGMNFALHFFFWKTRKFKTYYKDSELRTYLLLIAVIGVLLLALLHSRAISDSASHATRMGLFQTISFATTTGFTTTSYGHWPAFVPVMLLFMSFVGGCAGSTGGGIKVIRLLLLFKQGARETFRLIHPSATMLVKVRGKSIDENILESVWGFFSAYVFMFVVLMLIMLFTGMDQVTAFSAVAASLNNLGPGLGDVAANYASISDVQKWILSLAMVFGRLEIFTLLVVMTPAFWRR